MEPTSNIKQETDLSSSQTIPNEKEEKTKTIEEFQSQVEILLEEFLSSGEMEEASCCLEELKSPEFYTEFVKFAVIFSLDKKNRDRGEIGKLICYLFTKGLLSPDNLALG